MFQVSTNTSLPVEVENMEALLREAEQIKAIRPGELVQGVIMRVDPDGLLVSIGNKSEGIVSSREMRSLSEEEVSSLKIGEEILTRVLEAEREDGSTILSVDRAKEEIGWLDIEKQFHSGESVTVQGTITGFNRGGALVEVNVSLATTETASSSQYRLLGKVKVPSRQPPAPHHLLRPALIIVPSG